VSMVMPTRQLAGAYFFSDDGTALLKEAEALFLAPYDDQTEKPTSVWVPGATIGYGHLILECQGELQEGR
jgi:lysozyme